MYIRLVKLIGTINLLAFCAATGKKKRSDAKIVNRRVIEIIGRPEERSELS